MNVNNNNNKSSSIQYSSSDEEIYDTSIDEGSLQYYERGHRLRCVNDGMILSENGDDGPTEEDLQFIKNDSDLSESGRSSESE